MQAGDTWNESIQEYDEVAAHSLLRLTTTGRINQTPTYHTGSAFTGSGLLPFASVRDGQTWIIAGDPETGQLRAVWRAPGLGDRNYIHRGMGLGGPGVDGLGIAGNRVCADPSSSRVVFCCGRQLLWVDCDTLEQRVLIKDCGRQWIYGAPSVSHDGTRVAVCLSSSHPELARMEDKTTTLGEVPSYRSYANHRLKVVVADMDGRTDPVVACRPTVPAQSAHCAFSPVDRSVLYFDLDLPPGYWGGSDGRTPRLRILDLDTGTQRALKPNWPGPFQTHSAWLPDGSGLACHGPATAGGTYISVVNLDGTTRWEMVFEQADCYGHLTPAVHRPGLVLDGDFSGDLLQLLDYTTTTDPAHPALTPLCRHATEWNSLPGQYSHPHPVADPTGRYISFNRARDGRSDIMVLSVG